MEDNSKSYASGIIRTVDNKYLTFYHSQKKEHPWRFAGGKIEPGETPIGACARELYEEIGVTCTSLTLMRITKPKDIDGARWKGYFYLVEGGENWTIRELDKVSKAAYFTKEQLLENNCHPEFEIVEGLEEWEKYRQELWEKPWQASLRPYVIR